MTNNKATIGFIGAGNMASCLIYGLLKDGWPVEKMMVCCRTLSHHLDIQALGIEMVTDVKLMAKNTDILVLATKPQQAQSAVAPLLGLIDHQCMISLAAGLCIENIQPWIGEKVDIIRAMPNTPAKISLGITGLYAEPNIKDKYAPICEMLFSTLGEWQWIESETLMNALTATSGSGPAYVFLMAEAMIKAAVQLGLPEETAKHLVIDTLYGAASLLKNGDQSPTTLKQHVTSKGGTTEAALNSFSINQFEQIILKAMQAATTRGQELNTETNKR